VNSHLTGQAWSVAQHLLAGGELFGLLAPWLVGLGDAM
jgi:hypothetical protein